MFHVHMLKRIYPPEAAGYWVEEKCVGWKEGNCIEDNDDMPWWKCEEGGPPLVSTILGNSQRQQLQALLESYSAVQKSKPGRTNFIEHVIDVGNARLI